MTRFIRLTGGETRFMSHTKRPSGPNTIDGVLEVCPLSSGSSSRTPFDPALVTGGSGFFASPEGSKKCLA